MSKTDMKSMKVLITGGAGFLGINLVRYLLEKGITNITSYDLADFNYPERDRINLVTGDIRCRETVKSAINGSDIVVHAAAALPLYRKEEIYSTDVEGTKILLEESFNSQVDRFIHISSTAVYGIPDHHPLYEDDRLVGVGFYGHAKILAEQMCEKFRNKGMAITIIRPKSFVGPERLGVFALLYDWALDGKNFPLIGSGKNRYQLLDVQDLCQSIYLSFIENKKAVSDTFNIGAKVFTTMKEDYQRVLDEAGFGKKIISFPAQPVVATLRLLEFLHLSPLYKWVYETAYKDSFVSVEKAEKILGFRPEYSNKEALVRNFKWYVDNLDSFSGQSGISHRVPWKQGILKLIKRFF